MARQRTIKPDFYTDEKLARCSPHARLLFPGLWTLADKRGRLKDQPPVIHGAVFPFEPTLDVDGLLGELDRGGFIVRYEVEDRRYISIPNFERHQRPHPKEVESLIPPAVKRHGSAVKVHGSSLEEQTCIPQMLSVPSVPSGSSDNGQRTSALPRGDTPSPVAWSRQACDAWIERFGGTAPGGQIGKALKPLVDRHGWEIVRQAWASYLRQVEPEYASASRFASTFGRWSGTAPPGAKSTAAERTVANLEAWVAGKESR